MKRRPAIVSRGASCDPNPWSAPSLYYTTIAISFISNGNFHSKLVGPEDSNLQQIVGVCLWLGVVAISYFRVPLLRVPLSAGLVLSLGVYGLAILSPIWATDPMASMMKAGTLAIVAFGAYRLTQTLDVDRIIEGVYLGQFAVLVASIGMALFVPEIGVMDTYQHAGQWCGVFWSKQSLGLLGAVFLFFSCYRLLVDSRRRAFHAVGVAVALVCTIASGSRGGCVLAIFAVLCLYLTLQSTHFARALAFLPFAMCLTGVALVAYFVDTGSEYLVIFDYPFDFTERTFIWRHALSFFPERKWLGFGLNGFWTLPDVKGLFIERHGWFLDNYHDGYIAIAMETGVIGLALFIGGALIFGQRIVARIEIDRRLDPEVALALAYTCLIFFINFTETIFLRSTNVQATLLLVFMFFVYAGPAFIAAPARRPVQTLLKAPPAGRVRLRNV
jgi:exopolysaccharide production protein ExoQ